MHCSWIEFYNYLPIHVFFFLFFSFQILYYSSLLFFFFWFTSSWFVFIHWSPVLARVDLLVIYKKQRIYSYSNCHVAFCGFFLLLFFLFYIILFTFSVFLRYFYFFLLFSPSSPLCLDFSRLFLSLFLFFSLCFLLFPI